MSKYLLTHGHLVLDGKREYLDGAILFEDNKILQIYPHSNQIKEKEAEEINLRGQLVFPFYNGNVSPDRIVVYDPEKNDALTDLLKIKQSEDYVGVKDLNPDLTALILKNLPRNRVILLSRNISISLLNLHERGFSYSDLSMLICGNLETSQGRTFGTVKGNSVNFVIMNHQFKTLFKVVNGEFIYA